MTEALFLERIKKLAVKGQNTLVRQVQFLSLGQDRNDSINSYMSRLWEAAVGCQFEVPVPPCPTCDCACRRMASYTDKIISHQMVQGLGDPSIQEKVLSKGEEVAQWKDMIKYIKYIETLEMAKQDQAVLSGVGGLNRQGW